MDWAADFDPFQEWWWQEAAFLSPSAAVSPWQLVAEQFL
jgi:hypothetical protein